MFDKEKLEKEFFEDSKNAGEKEAQKVLENEDNIFKKILESTDLKEFYEDVKIFFMMIKDFFSGRCDIPIRTIAAISIALLYVLNPFDLIPDAIPVIGYIDDAFVLRLCIKFVKDDIEEYKRKCLFLIS